MRVRLEILWVAFAIGCGTSGRDDPAQPDAANAIDAGPCTKPPVFLNLLRSGGETYEPDGADDSRTNRSRLLDAPAQLAPMQGDTAAVLAATRALLEPHGIVVTDVDPGDTPHIEIVLVGSGWPFDPGYAALAHGYCTPNPNAVAMINAFAGRKPGDLAVSAAFVLGVVNGLAYSDDRANCMALTLGGQTCAFSNASPVTQPPRCPGEGTIQDQLAILTQNLACE